MDKKYKLIYFDFKGYGECIKYIFAYAKVEYDLETVTFSYEKSAWDDMKPLMPFGQLPVLEYDGKKLYQSQAICQYLANKYNLLTGNAWDDAELAALAGALQDFVSRVARYYYEPNAEIKIKLKAELESKVIPYYFERFENILKSKGEFFAGKLTWIDFYLVGGFETIIGMMNGDFIKGKYSALRSLMEKVWNLPGVKEYVAIRPSYIR